MTARPDVTLDDWSIVTPLSSTNKYSPHVYCSSNHDGTPLYAVDVAKSAPLVSKRPPNTKRQRQQYGDTIGEMNHSR
jgi:hypothetical protein